MTAASLFTFGVLATLPMGPAGLNVASSALKQRSFPFKAFSGFVIAEMLYLLIAYFVKDLMLQNLQTWTIIVSLIAGVFVLGFAIHLIQKKPKSMDLKPAPSGVLQSFLITASNPGILLLHLTVLLQVEALSTLLKVKMVSSFLLGGVLTLVGLVWLLLSHKDFFYKHSIKVQRYCGYGLLVMAVLIFRKAIILI